MRESKNRTRILPPCLRTLEQFWSYFSTLSSHQPNHQVIDCHIIIKIIVSFFLFNFLFLPIDFPIVWRHLKFNNIGRESDEAIECDVSVSPQVLWSIIKYYPQQLGLNKHDGGGGGGRHRHHDVKCQTYRYMRDTEKIDQREEMEFIFLLT